MKTKKRHVIKCQCPKCGRNDAKCETELVNGHEIPSLITICKDCGLVSNGYRYHA